ncbi:MAG: Mov34/MPN/PAD-1 family protein [Methanobacteriota archaeon]
MTLLLTPRQVRAIEDHAREAFPEECCGFLLGRPGESKEVDEVERTRNVVETNRERRYVIEPRDILRVDRAARGAGREILGFYHSHPNHPARPSPFDESHAAWPGYSYVILSIVDGSPNDLRSWVLEKEGGPFRAETLSITAE